MTDPILSTEAAAAYLGGVSEGEVRLLMRNGSLRHFRIGRLYRTRQTWLDEYVEANARGGHDAAVRGGQRLSEAGQQVDRSVGAAARGRAQTPPPARRRHRGSGVEADERREGIEVQGPQPKRHRRRVLGKVAA